MILFKKTAYSDGLVNLLISLFGGSSVDFIDGPYWAKLFVLCFYTIWVVMPFKILILTSALASVNQIYYNAARVDGTSRFRIFRKITVLSDYHRLYRRVQGVQRCGRPVRHRPECGRDEHHCGLCI